MNRICMVVSLLAALLAAVACTKDPSQGRAAGQAPGAVSDQGGGAGDEGQVGGEGLVEVLIERRKDGEPIYVADCTKQPESAALTAIKEELRRREVAFVEPQWANYQYYLNRVIPMTRRRGRVWIVFDRSLEELTRTLTEGYLDQHSVAFRQDFGDLTLALVTNEFRDASPARYALKPVLGRSGTTSNIAFTRDGEYMFVTSKEGVFRWLSRRDGESGEVMRMPRAGKGTAGLFSGGESGVIGLALHPAFEKNRLLYIHYNWRTADGKRAAVLSEWKADFSAGDQRVSFGDERQLLTIEQVHDNHNAGCLVFGPDGYLYIGVGDGEDGKWTIGRSPAGSLRGKVLRIDVDRREGGKGYAIPADNPFVDDDRFPPETWAWGFRNPWRLAFVPDGRLIASDIGEDVNEELTFVVKGKHHGWPYFEGAHVRNPWTLDAPLQPSLLPYGREYGMSVIAGNVYEGTQLPELVGKFVFCDYMNGHIWAFSLPGTDETLGIEAATELVRWPLLLATITKSPDGELYFGAHTGEVLQLVRGDAAAPEHAPAAKPDYATVRGMFGTEFSAPAAPAVTPEQRAVGKMLFADKRLSADGAASCATCHPLSEFGQDGRVVAGAAGPARNTAAVVNASRQFAQFRDYRVETVEQAVVESLTSHMGNETPAAAVARVASDPAFVAAFGPDGGTPENVGLAIGAYIRSLVTVSRWEQFLDGDDEALTDGELVGLGEFLDAGCITCHMYRGLGGGMPQKLGLVHSWTGPDRGRGLLDDTPGQEYFFKVPALLNVAETGPWYHDGSMKSLEAAVKHMAKAQFGRELSEPQAASIVTFLKSLSGELPKGVR